MNMHAWMYLTVFIGMLLSITSTILQKYDKPNPFELKEREWSKKDVGNLKKTLGYLEFDVKPVENVSKSKINKGII